MNENRAMSKTESSDASAGQGLKPESVNSISVDRHPNLTLLESGQNPGEILRAAREKAGFSLSDISAQTKINERQLEAIESGDVGRLPPETFAKAFIKSYCKALKMDPTPVILSFGFSESSMQSKAARHNHSESGRTEPLEPKMPNSSKRLSTLNFDRKTGKKSLSYGIVLAVVVVMAVFYIPVFMSSQDIETGNSEITEPVANEAPVSVAPVPESPGQSDSSSTLMLDAPPIAGVDSPIFPALQQPSANEPAPPPVAAALPASPEVVTQANEPLTQSALAGSDGVLRFNFQEQSWVTVRDANDKVLISQLNDAGSKLEVRGQSPFKLIVGNAKAVSVVANGSPVDLTGSIRGEVARVTVQ